MAQRLIHAVIAATVQEVATCLEDAPVESLWMVDVEAGVLEVTLLLDMNASENVLDTLEHTFADREHFRLVLLAVEASLPRPENPDTNDADDTDTSTDTGTDTSTDTNGNKADNNRPREQAQTQPRLHQPIAQAAPDVQAAFDAHAVPSVQTAFDAHAAPETKTTKTAVEDEQDTPRVARVSREELYNDVSESITVSWRYIIMVVLSTVVAAAGMLRDSVAVIIGAMVIAPLLGANVALSLATTLADVALARRAIVINALGLAVALLMSLAVGWLLPVSLESSELAARTSVSIADVGVALASGVAGALAFTGGTATATIGVMVAVALLPPWVAVGLLLGAGSWQAASGALLLFGCNVICVNLAGVVTFLVQGLRPAAWREAQQAKRASRIALLIWLALLGLLVLLIVLAERLQT